MGEILDGGTPSEVERVTKNDYPMDKLLVVKDTDWNRSVY